MEILIAEDDLVSGKLLQKLLGKKGHEVIHAADGLKAWVIFQKKKPRMVITDWMMPEMDGLSLCRKIRSAPSDTYVYIILLTAKSEKKDAVEGLEAGADDYIVKPFDREELHARVRAGRRVIDLEDRYSKAHLQLLQSEKMASVGRLAAGVAHEINNPIGFVSSNMKSLGEYHADIKKMLDSYGSMARVLQQAFDEKKFDPNLPELIRSAIEMEDEIDIGFIIEDMKDLIHECRNGTDRIKKIVQEMRDFARPGDDNAKAEDLNFALTSTIRVFTQSMDDRIKFETNLQQIPRVKFMPRQLNQVFLNMFHNAAGAITGDGTIQVETRPGDQCVEILIKDNGIGIPEEDMGRIFDPFFTTKEIGDGTGLGLNLAFNVVKMHNGTIKVESQTGKGTTFIIRLPVD